MAEIPDRINIDKQDRDLYNELDKEEMLRSKGGRRSRKEQFLFAMSIGFKNDVCHALESNEGWFLAKDLQPRDSALLNAVALNKTGTVEILANKAEVYKIAEEYAHAGIRLLYDKIKSIQYGSFDKFLEKELQEIYEKIPKNM